MSRSSKDLIAGLVGDLQPVAPVRLGRLFFAALILETVVIALATSAAGLRHDLAERLAEPTFVLMIGTLAVAAAASTAVALRMATPGREVGGGTAGSLLVYPILVAVLVAVFAPWGRSWWGIGPLLDGCWNCVKLTSMTATVPWVFLVFLLRGLAPLRGLRVGVFAGLSAFLVGAMATQLHCPAGDGYHLALGHYLPIAVLAAITTVVAAQLLRLRSLDPS